MSNKQERVDTLMSEDFAKEVWREADAVCFDVDSTVIQVEGIDELASFMGVAEEVKAWTKRAMGGNVKFQDSLKARLDIVNPTVQNIKDFNEKHAMHKYLTPKVEDLMKLLMKMNKRVFLVSGGFRDVIEPLAEHLEIPQKHVYANRMVFDGDGNLIGVDQDEPTCRTGGKAVVAASVKRVCTKVVMIGDGYTDLEASPPADTFIGFGGNVVRDNVRERASWYIYHFSELIEELVLPTSKAMKITRRISTEYNSDMKRPHTEKALTYKKNKSKPKN